MKKLQDYVHSYDGHNPRHDAEGRCRIQIFEREGSAPLIVCTSLPNSPGLSITNACEYIAGEVIARFFPDLNEHPVWIERYPSKPSARVGMFPEYARVRFQGWWPRQKYVAGRRRMKTGVPRWEWLTAEKVEEILGGPPRQILG